MGLAAVGMLVAAQSASAAIFRPQGATPVSVSMVPAYAPCTVATPAGNAHNPATAPGAACSPPVKATPRLTVGSLVYPTAPQFQGQIKLIGGPGGPTFPSGGPTGNYFKDVRCELGYATSYGAGRCNSPGSGNQFSWGGQGAPPDYTGDLNAIIPVRLTDEANSGTACPPTCNGNDATVQDFNFAIPSTATSRHPPRSAPVVCPGMSAEMRCAGAGPQASA